MNSVFITACNRGAGLEFVKQLLSRSGYPRHVFATCRNEADAEELRKLKSENSDRLHIFELDVTDYAKLPEIVRTVDGVVGEDGLNILINNAGMHSPHGRELSNVTPEVMREHFELNSIAPLMLAQAFHPLLKRAADRSSDQPMGCSRAAIINITSRMGSLSDNTSGTRYAYRASKAALNMITISESVDLKNDGILCVVIHPGWMKTRMGGPNGLVSAEEAVQGMLKLMEGFKDCDSGLFYHYNGNKLPW